MRSVGEPPQGEPQSPARMAQRLQRYWKNVVERFGATRIGILLLGLITVAGVIGNLDKAIETIYKWVGPGADLVVADLQSGERLRPIGGYPVLLGLDQKGPDGKGPIYTGGVHAILWLTHNERGSTPVHVRGVKLQVEYKPGKNALYSYRPDLGAVVGRGPAPPLRFNVKITGDSVEIWKVDKHGKLFPAEGQDLFRTDPPTRWELQPSGEIGKELLLNVVVREAGLYSLTFQIHYMVGPNDHFATTKPIRLYVQ